jgi:hypothetical protein
LAATLAALTGIEPYEVLQVLHADRRWPRPAAGPAGVQVLTVWGRTGSGRRLIVVLRPASRLDWWIVGAREMYPAEVADYDRWEADQ